MSNSLAIATVTEAFRLLLDEAAAESGVSGAIATKVRPIPPTGGGGLGGLPPKGVNLFLYQTMPNAAFRNVDLPTRRGDGSSLQTSRSAYDLSYLLTFYGDDNAFEAQAVLGSVLRKLHAEPLLTTERVKNAEGIVDSSFPPDYKSNLEMEVEKVKVALMPLSLEELSKLWSIFLQTPYTLSLNCQASAVFVDGREPAGPALPVLSRNVYVRTFRQPLIDKVLSQKTAVDPIVEDQPILPGYILVLQGRRMQADVTHLRVGDLEVTPTDLSDIQIKIPLTEPSPFPTDSLRAGLLGVQVLQYLNMGTPETAHKGFESNVLPFVLRPIVTASSVMTGSKVIDSVTYHDATVTLHLTPKIGVDQRLVLLLNEYNPPADRVARAYLYDVKLPDAPPDSVASVDLDVKTVAAGDYLVRVQVDGAESVLDPGPDPLHPKFIGPLVTI